MHIRHTENKRCFYLKDGIQIGLGCQEAVIEALQKGEITPATLVWDRALLNWVIASDSEFMRSTIFLR